MKAIVLSEYGGVDKLELKEWAEPDPGPGQVQVRVRSASINPIGLEAERRRREGADAARAPGGAWSRCGGRGHEGRRRRP